MLAKIGKIFHNLLSGLQGGTTNEYYHLTSAEKTLVESGLVKLDQATPQEIINGIPTLSPTRVISQDNQLIDKKYADDVAAGLAQSLYTLNFVTTDWVGSSAPYSITVQQSTHLLGATKNLIVDVKEDSGTDNQVVYDSPVINDNGDVTIYTNTPFNGSVLICNGMGHKGDKGDRGDDGLGWLYGTVEFGAKGASITTGDKAEVRVPYNGIITGWEIVGSDANSSIVVDIQKSNYSSYGTYVSIAGTEKPTLVSQRKNTDLDLSSWTPNIAEGDYLKAVVDSASDISSFLVSLKITRS